MATNKKRLALEQLDKTLASLSGLQSTSGPPKGWIRAVREALGMSGVQFARRLGVRPPRVTALEKEERAGALTIRTMRQAAEALDCTFAYTLIPRASLAETVRKQAEKVTRARLARTSHNMLLEGQQLAAGEMQDALQAAVDYLVRNMPKELWEEP